MKTVAVRVPDEWKLKMKRLQVRWSDVLRGAIEERLQQAEREQVLQEFVHTKPRSPGARRGSARRSVREDRDAR